MVAHVFWSATLHNAIAGSAYDSSSKASSNPPRVAARNLLLHNHWLVELPDGIYLLLAPVGVHHYQTDGTPSTIGRHEVVTKNGVVFFCIKYFSTLSTKACTNHLSKCDKIFICFGRCKM